MRPVQDAIHPACAAHSGNRTVLVAQHAGFCFGVGRATAAVEQEIASHPPGERIYTLGRLIHNQTYTQRLRERGVTVVSTQELPALCAQATPEAPVKVFVRAHGMTDETQALLDACVAQNPSFLYVDCTCSFVKKIHRICEEQSDLCRAAAEASPEGVGDRFLLVLGSPDHPEVVGFLSRFKGETFVFPTAAALQDLIDRGLLPQNRPECPSKIPIMVAQTTHNLVEWENSKNVLKKNYTNSLIFDTICSVTELRQQEAAALARECDIIIVIGGRDSSNSAKLFSICQNICADTVWVECAEDLPSNILLSCHKVGVVAGASTPRDIIEEVTNKMSEQTQIENFEELLEDSFRTSSTTINTGDTVIGTVTAINAGEIQLDLGAKVTGVIKMDQITDDTSVKLDEMFKIGDKVEAFVIRVSDVDGFATLSKKRVDSDKNWKKIAEAYETQENLEGKVIAVNKGGVVALVYDNQVFIPAAHSGVPRDGDLSALVGQTVTLRILEIKDGKKAKGSIRLVLRDERRAKEKEFWDTIEEGKEYTGTVKSMTSYGAFVDLGGVDGMVHCSELSWKHIKSPAEVVSVGDVIHVFVKSFNVEKKRISLGYKTETTNPWYIFTHQYAVGDIASVKIVSLMPFGAFAEIVDGVDGLIHISQIADRKIGKPADVLEIGQIVDAKIIDIDSENQKISLSIRALIEEAKAMAEAMPEDFAEEVPADVE